LPATEGEGIVAPRNPTERLLLEMWQRILGANAIGVDDSFFDLGGHSLLAVRLLDEVNSTFQVELPLRSLFDPPTIAGLAEKILATLGSGFQGEPEEHLDLGAEAVLDSAIAPRGEWEFASPRSILLTGATGFLGAYLLAELLERTEARVTCLLRASERREGQQRLQRHMASLNLWRDEYSDRMFVVCGDLAMRRLGLSTGDYTQLAAECDTIYHSGAMVNFFYPYRVMKGANVVGTEEILRLACHTRQKNVHYISSMGVFPQASILVPDGEWPWTMREDDDSDWRGLGMGYTQSKWVAERLAHLARARGIPIAIYRPTITYGHTETGHGNERDFLYRLIFSCSQLGFVPEIDSDLNLVPIDFVIKGIVALSLQAGCVGQVFHLVNPESTPLKKILDCVVSLGGIERIPYEDWRERLIAAPDNVLAALARNFPEHNSDTRRNRNFHSGNADRLLANSRIRCPGISSRMLELYVSRILENSSSKPPMLVGAFKEND
jgi:thioester reductase-like protein